MIVSPQQRERDKEHGFRPHIPGQLPIQPGSRSPRDAHESVHPEQRRQNRSPELRHHTDQRGGQRGCSDPGGDTGRPERHHRSHRRAVLQGGDQRAQLVRIISSGSQPELFLLNEFWNRAGSVRQSDLVADLLEFRSERLFWKSKKQLL